MDCVLDFARGELQRYWRRVTGQEECGIGLEVDKSLFESGRAGFDPELDDGWRVEVARGKGRICGANARSVLLGVYGLLRAAGCRFLRPGRGGERLVRAEAESISVSFSQVPVLRHRGVTIEGAVSRENVLDMVDWLPKAGFNAYFLQFRNSYEFYERWYRHGNNPNLAPQPFTMADADRIRGEVTAEVNRRGLLFHAVGHGWTCEPLGFDSRGWREVEDSEVPDSLRKFLAEVDGRRGLFRGVPLNTNLCYSNPAARALVVEEVAGYLRLHPEVDYLHFWLADNYNNFCECASCREKTPTDHYVTLLNELDARLTAEGNRAKIVFLIYYELMYPPVREKLRHPERFVMMFAPISRTYAKSYLDGVSMEEVRRLPLKPFRLNRIENGKDLAENLSYLVRWQQHFIGDSFVFDYHLMWDEYKDYANVRLAEVLFRDIRSLPALGLNGYISCQVQRAFFPTGLCMYVLGAALSNPDADFSGIVEEYFSAAFGDNGEEIFRMLRETSYGMNFEYVRGDIPSYSPQLAEQFASAQKSVKEEFLPSAQRMLAEEEDDFYRINLKEIVLFFRVAEKLAALLCVKCRTEPVDNLPVKYYNEIKETIDINEEEWQAVLDGMFFTTIVGDMAKGVW